MDARNFPTAFSADGDASAAAATVASDGADDNDIGDDGVGLRPGDTRREQHQGRIFLLGREKERRRTVLISLSQVVCPDLSTGLCPNLSSWSVLISQKFLL